MEILAVRSALVRPSVPNSNWGGTALGRTMNKIPPEAHVWAVLMVQAFRAFTGTAAR